MAVGKRRNGVNSMGATRMIVGQFRLNGNESETRLTISKSLDGYDFPNETGEEVKVELVVPDDEPAFLEVHPVADNGH